MNLMRLWWNLAQVVAKVQGAPIAGRAIGLFAYPVSLQSLRREPSPVTHPLFAVYFAKGYCITYCESNMRN